jgi:putative tricarboxylic transport membrane protein
MLYKARHGGFRNMEDITGERPYWAGFAWMSAGLLANAALITSLGFILSCTVCFVMAARGLRNAESDQQAGVVTWFKDILTGLLIAAPVYWMFTQFLGINLPGLTDSGWL